MNVTWSIGLQSRKGMCLGGNPDMDEVAQTAYENGIKEALVFGKDHTGYCFHPTRYGVSLPGLKYNLTKGLADAMHKKGIRAIAYVNFGLDGEAGRRHREWLQESAPGTPSLITRNHYASLCVFSGYLKDYLMPVIKEMLTECDVDGFFFDTMSAFYYCTCPVCRKAFKKKFGVEMPRRSNPDDPAWKLYSPWQYERMYDCIKDVRRQIEEWKSGASVVFNHIGNSLMPYPMPGVLEGKVSGDPPAFFPKLSMNANYLSSMPHTGEIFIERFARGWRDRNSNNELTMRYKSAVIFAHRQDFCVGDRIHFEWRMAPGSVPALKIIQKVADKFNRELPASLKSAPDFLLLEPESYFLGHARQSFQQHADYTNYHYMETLPGAFRMLLDCGRSFMLLPEMNLKRHLELGRTLIIPAAEYLKPETDKIIREFVAARGTVLLTGKVPKLDNGSLPDWCGIKSAEEDKKSKCTGAVFLPDLGSCRRKKDDERPLLDSNVCKVTLDGAAPVLYAYPQEFRELFLDSNSPFYLSSAEKPMKDPLLTRFHYGKGNTWFLNCALFTDYTDSAFAVHKQWTENLLRLIHPKAAFELVSPAGDVEIVSYTKPANGGSVHVLLNHGGRRGSLKNPGLSEQLATPQPAYPVTLKIRTQDRLNITVDGKRVKGIRKGQFIQVPVIMDTLWKFIKAVPAK